MLTRGSACEKKDLNAKRSRDTIETAPCTRNPKLRAASRVILFIRTRRKFCGHGRKRASLRTAVGNENRWRGRRRSGYGPRTIGATWPALDYCMCTSCLHGFRPRSEDNVFTKGAGGASPRLFLTWIVLLQSGGGSLGLQRMAEAMTAAEVASNSRATNMSQTIYRVRSDTSSSFAGHFVRRLDL